MKTKLILLAFCIFVGISQSEAQHVRLRLNFPVNVIVGARGPAPFSGAIWIGPEWAWRGNRYECVPGYWAKPIHSRARWIPGHWQRSRRGHLWVAGYWR
jgi:hypothetical protein